MAGEGRDKGSRPIGGRCFPGIRAIGSRRAGVVGSLWSLRFLGVRRKIGDAFAGGGRAYRRTFGRLENCGRHPRVRNADLKAELQRVGVERFERHDFLLAQKVRDRGDIEGDGADLGAGGSELT